MQFRMWYWNCINDTSKIVLLEKINLIARNKFTDIKNNMLCKKQQKHQNSARIHLCFLSTVV